MIDVLTTITAVASALATGFAAFATWQGPRAAAELAEKLRGGAEIAQERKRQKFWVFATLMQERSAIYSDNAVKALNIIDAVFHDARSVREAWVDLYSGFSSPAVMQSGGINDKITRLLREIAKDIGLGDQLGQADFIRTYTPEALVQERIVRDLERKQALERLQTNTSPAANSEPRSISAFPPPPT